MSIPISDTPSEAMPEWRSEFRKSSYVQNYLLSEPSEFEFKLSDFFLALMEERYALDKSPITVPQLVHALSPKGMNLKEVYCRGSLIDSRYAASFFHFFLEDPKLFLAVFIPWIIDPLTGRIHFYKISGKQVVQVKPAPQTKTKKTSDWVGKY